MECPGGVHEVCNDVLRTFIDRLVCAHLDDVLIYRKTKAKHLAHLRQGLRTLREHKSYTKLSKCEIGRTFLAFLGHIVSPNGFEMECRETEAIRVCHDPKSNKEAASLFGLVTCYRSFVRDMPAVAKPLTDFTGNLYFAWTDP